MKNITLLLTQIIALIFGALTVAGVTDGEKTKEVMIAKRVGDC